MSWNYAYTPNIWPSLLTVLLLLTLAIYSGRKRNMPGAAPFAIGSLLAGLWVTGSALRYAAVEVDAQIFWYKFESLWQLSAITAITCFILDYAWPGRWLTRRNLILLAIIPLLDILLILTNNLHHMQWRSFTYDGFLIPRQGVMGWFAFAYGMGLGIPNIIVLVWLFLRSPAHRWPVFIILIGQVTVRVVYLLNVATLLHSELPLDTLSIGFVFLMYAIVLFGFRIFDPVSLAQQTAIEQLHTGILVLDSQERVVSMNPAAERILGMRTRQARSQTIKNLLARYPDISLPAPDGTETELNIASGQELRHYILSISALKDFRQLDIGYLLMMRDMTEQKLAQAKIVEQQQAMAMLHEREHLARELHDSLGQIFAFINTQGQTIHRLLDRGDISTAQRYVDRLVEVARDADMDIRESILGLRTTLDEQGFLSILEKYLARFEKNFNIRTELIKPEAIGNDYFKPLVEVQLMRILQEALTNVRKHASADSVRITFTLEDHFVRMTVQDDGQGFDSGARFGKVDEHIGLRVMQERAEEVGGNVKVYSEPGHGTVVEVCMPVKERGATR
jgi:PAS domain S-box-containing protein